jgi:hypothetical protein
MGNSDPADWVYTDRTTERELREFKRSEEGL